MSDKPARFGGRSMGSPIESVLSNTFEAVRESRGISDRQLWLEPQARVAGYEFDFLVHWEDAPVFGVECDGHDFHERTRQQASYDRARDHALLKVGFPTVRFTGSDIHRDSEQCAIEIIELAHALRGGGRASSPTTPRSPVAKHRATIREAIMRVLRFTGPVNSKSKIWKLSGKPKAAVHGEINAMFDDGSLVLDGGLITIVDPDLQALARAEESRLAAMDADDMRLPDCPFERFLEGNA